MSQRTWIILGATSIIAKEFSYLVGASGHNLCLVGRDKDLLTIKAADLRLRFAVSCEIALLGTESFDGLLLDPAREFDVFIAQSDCTENGNLTEESLKQLLEINIHRTVLFIHQYLKRKQSQHHLVFLSSVAALRGRAKNSLYGGSKAAIEVYLQGLQQQATPNKRISIARLGFIDTQQTYGKPGIFHAAAPKDCAKACWKAVNAGKRQLYFPFYWKIIMAVFCRLPFFIIKRMKEV